MFQYTVYVSLQSTVSLELGLLEGTTHTHTHSQRGSREWGSASGSWCHHWCWLSATRLNPPPPPPPDTHTQQGTRRAVYLTYSKRASNDGQGCTLHCCTVSALLTAPPQAQHLPQSSRKPTHCFPYRATVVPARLHLSPQPNPTKIPLLLNQ